MPKEFDLHGHTREGSWWELVNYDILSALRRAKEIGLDGVAITQHWTLAGIDTALNLAQKEGIIVVPGVELSARVGLQAPHIIALGITPEQIQGKNETLPFLWSPKDTISWIHDHGAVAIAPHPYEKPNHISLSHQQVRELNSNFDGIETVTSLGVNREMADFAHKQQIAQIGSSDFHMLAQIGIAATQVPDSVTTWQDLIETIQNKQTQAFIKTQVPEKLQKARGFSVLLQQIIGVRM
ncbi:hypothetical protein HY469_01400 [Candidatus Roizmanbacteria bacterium]|nr:hypothetical protein [Candidatus Roizmanbacteria bacterium]